MGSAILRARNVINKHKCVAVTGDKSCRPSHEQSPLDFHSATSTTCKTHINGGIEPSSCPCLHILVGMDEGDLDQASWILVANLHGYIFDALSVRAILLALRQKSRLVGQTASSDI